MTRRKPKKLGRSEVERDGGREKRTVGSSRRYRALALLWHTHEHRYVAPGQEVDLSHLSEEEVLSLERRGFIETLMESRSRLEEGKEEERDGTADD